MRTMSSHGMDALPALLARHVKDLWETSLDDRRATGGQKEYLTKLAVPSIDFDAVKVDYHNEVLGGVPSEQPKSVDALLFDKGGAPVFVEFKNGKIDKRTIYGLHGKLYDSVLAYCDVTGSTLADLRERASFLVVYNEGRNAPEDLQKGSGPYDIAVSPSRASIVSVISAKAKKSFVRFGLQRFVGYCFKNIETVTESDLADCLRRHEVDIECTD